MKTYGDKWAAMRGFIRAGGSAEQFEASVMQRDGKWLVDDSALPKKVVQRKASSIRTRGYPPVDMSKHKTGDALIAHIRAFDKAHGLRSGSCYIIGGKEVRI